MTDLNPAQRTLLYYAQRYADECRLISGHDPAQLGPDSPEDDVMGHVVHMAMHAATAASYASEIAELLDTLPPLADGAPCGAPSGCPDEWCLRPYGHLDEHCPAQPGTCQLHDADAFLTSLADSHGDH